MYLSFNNHTIEVKSWQTKAEMLKYLSSCELGYKILGDEEEEEEIKFYSILIRFSFSGLEKFGIGVCSEGQGLEPHLLTVPKSDLLLLGVNRYVYGININWQKIVYKIKLNSLFSCFWYLDERDIILVFSEIGVMGLDEKGNILWQYAQDILTDAHLEGEQLHLEFMDESKISLSIATKTEPVDDCSNSFSDSLVFY